MDRTIPVSEVFNTFGQPKATYVERDDGKYERKLSSALDAKGEVCLLTGPSKTGKTTLWGKVLSDKKLDPIRVSGNIGTTAAEFWKIALEEINFERLSS